MTLQNDLIKHTIFLQRFATREQKKLVENIKAIAENAMLYANEFVPTVERRKQVVVFSKKVQEESEPLEGLYDYERKFIRKLLRKYGKDDSIK